MINNIPRDRYVTYFDASRTTIEEKIVKFDSTKFREEVLDDMKRAVARCQLDIGQEANEFNEGDFSNSFKVALVGDNTHTDPGPYNVDRRIFSTKSISVLDNHPFFRCLFEVIYSRLGERVNQDQPRLYSREGMELAVTRELDNMMPDRGMDNNLVGLSTSCGVYLNDEYGLGFTETGNYARSEMTSMLENLIYYILTMIPYLNREDEEFNMMFIAYCVARTTQYEYLVELYFGDDKIIRLLNDAGVMYLPHEAFNIYSPQELIQLEYGRLFGHENDLYTYFLNLLELVQSWDAIPYPAEIVVNRMLNKKNMEEYDPNNPFVTIIHLADLNNFKVAVFEIDNDEDLGVFESYAGRRALADLYRIGSASSMMMTGENHQPFVRIADCLTSIGAMAIIGSYIGEGIFHNPCLYVLYIESSNTNRALPYKEN